MSLKGTVTVSITFSDQDDEDTAGRAYAAFYPDPVDAQGVSLGLTGKALAEHFLGKVVDSKVCRCQQIEEDAEFKTALADPVKRAAMLVIANT